MGTHRDEYRVELADGSWLAYPVGDIAEREAAFKMSIRAGQDPYAYTLRLLKKATGKEITRWVRADTAAPLVIEPKVIEPSAAVKAGVVMMILAGIGWLILRVIR